MRKDVVILGAGPAGLWAAMELLSRFPGIGVTVLEKEAVPGGIAASFTEKGLVWDMGSHRFHPSASPGVFNSVKALLGEDLLTRKRMGRIRLGGRFLMYPLKPADMLLHLSPAFTGGVILDTLSSPLRRKAPAEGTFGEILEAGLGRTICENFYFPYAEKLWGLSPEKLDGEQARRRVSATSLGKMMKKIAGFSSGGGKGSIFHYPRGGFGTIFQRAAETVERLGGTVLFNTQATSITPPSSGVPGEVATKNRGRFPASFILSTLPVSNLPGMTSPPPPDSVVRAADSMEYRSMVLCFLKFRVPRFTPFDAHYFPDSNILFSRISERKNYDGVETPADSTGLCVEIPCWKGDPVWEMDDAGLIDTVLLELEKAGLKPPELDSGFSRKLSCAYPSYPGGWRGNYETVRQWLQGVPGLVSLGRQGFFAHDNTHHAMEMGFEAARCLAEDLSWDSQRWSRAEKTFRRHVVED